MTNDTKDTRKRRREPIPKERELLYLKGLLRKKKEECWINTRIQKKQRDAIDKLIKKGLYVSRSEFLRTAVKRQLRQDLELNNVISEKDEDEAD